MRRFGLLKLVHRRHLLSSLPLQSFIQLQGDSALRLALFRNQALHSCSSVIEKPVDFARTGLPLLQRYIHATASCCAPNLDYYEILGVSKDAGRDEIKMAFLALAKKYHPDANKNNPSAKRKFQEIREAYETLQDSEKRAQYDSMRAGGSENIKYDAGDAEGFKHAGVAWDFRFSSDAKGYRFSYRTPFSGSFNKIFSEIFEDEIDRVAPDIQVELLLSFSEAAKGCTKHLSFNAFVPCDSCHGHGHPLNAKTIVCPTCRGIGRVTIPPFTSTCSTCKGSGRIIKESCMLCQGSGVVEGVKEVTVTIPAGVEFGATIVVPKAGNAGGRGIQPGSLYIKLKALCCSFQLF
ncbi:DnaJ domain-containing protein/DnaJ_CXXCXGXG domain-containing protein [Cephalotus follicularis]|uniref:DnaJ domain-containing protein/DnaJ_CXXCXGXG domain-containing protein n=1 Tax=Cephalotus follicularis TaxID=3775 RepID=A0A1Q3BG16_CEPFO|nr:DnaJ domain-containing protein/DnaJ_CXXCXGXG domain-containing protein [Cephalotus follicularis]